MKLLARLTALQIQHPKEYNLRIEPEPKSAGMSPVVYDHSVNAFAKIGLLGEVHVDRWARVQPGHIRSDRTYSATFDIFSSVPTDESAREIVERATIQSSGFDEAARTLVDLGRMVTEMLAKADPLSALPFNTYRQLPQIPTMEISTPAGIQSLHVHTNGGGIVYFIQPLEEETLYDYGGLKTIFSSAVLAGLRETPSTGSFAGVRNTLRRHTQKRYMDMYSRLITNPGSIKRVEF